MGRNPIILLIPLVLAPLPARGIDLSLFGSWAETVDAADLESGAGSDLNGTYESQVEEVELTIFNTGGDSDNWRLDVRRTDTEWPPSLTLWIKRTSDGTGNGTISAGITYQEVTATDASLCIGSGDRDGINIQLRLTGMSVTCPPENYLSTVVYTVVDTP